MTTQTCPGCGSPVTLPGRTFCRPSCRAKHQHRQAPPTLPLLDPEAVLDPELPPARPRGRGEA